MSSPALGQSPTPAAPLVITSVAAPGGATLGLTHCPGRCGGGYGQRNLKVDLAAIEAWRADMVISLVEAHEFERLGVPTFVADVLQRRFQWQHVPIPDFGTPSAATWAAWNTVRRPVVDLLARQGRLVLHCAAGLGRTGTIAAKLLSEQGFSVDEAVHIVRTARPGAIETDEQLAFVLRGPRLL